MTGTSQSAVKVKIIAGDRFMVRWCDYTPRSDVSVGVGLSVTVANGLVAII